MGIALSTKGFICINVIVNVCCTELTLTIDRVIIITVSPLCVFIVIQITYSTKIVISIISILMLISKVVGAYLHHR